MLFNGYCMKKTPVILISLAFFGVAIALMGEFNENNGLILIGICLILGFLVKLTDQLIDDKTMKKYRFLILPFAIAIPILMIYIADINDPVFGMVIGTAFGLLVAGKLDHPAYIISVVTFIVVIILLKCFDIINITDTSIYLIPLAFCGAFGDEFGHEKVTKKNTNKVITLFFKHRFALKTAAIIGVLIDWAEIIHFIGFLCFDLGYEIVDYSWKFKK